ncbi:MAG: hypothetical protein ACE5EN_06690 [Nitrospinota bacterium]
MIFPVSSAYRASSLYDLQKTYSERVKAYSPKRKVMQAQNDRVSLTPEAMESLAHHRDKKPDRQPIYYLNPALSKGKRKYSDYSTLLTQY